MNLWIVVKAKQMLEKLFRERDHLGKVPQKNCWGTSTVMQGSRRLTANMELEYDKLIQGDRARVNVQTHKETNPTAS